jgi:hypothetical protein
MTFCCGCSIIQKNFPRAKRFRLALRPGREHFSVLTIRCSAKRGTRPPRRLLSDADLELDQAAPLCASEPTLGALLHGSQYQYASEQLTEIWIARRAAGSNRWRPNRRI